MDCKGILVHQLKNSQEIDHNVSHSSFLGQTLVSSEDTISKDFRNSSRKKDLANTPDSFSVDSSEKIVGFSMSQILSELPPVDELGRIIYTVDSDNTRNVSITYPRARSRRSDEPFGFIFTGPSLGSDPSFVEISLDNNITNEEQDNFDIHLKDTSLLQLHEP